MGQNKLYKNFYHTFSNGVCNQLIILQQFM